MIIKLPFYMMEPYAARLNAGLISIIDAGTDTRLVDGYDAAWDYLESWLGQDRWFAVGKNASMFDLPFMEQHGFEVRNHFKHRVLDAGSLYATPEGIPSLPEILEQVESYGIVNPIKGNLHEALYDARLTLWVTQRALNATVVL
jgi:oligoribonuclease (3'-5' exoribonuclease)